MEGEQICSVSRHAPIAPNPGQKGCTRTAGTEMPSGNLSALMFQTMLVSPADFNGDDMVGVEYNETWWWKGRTGSVPLWTCWFYWGAAFRAAKASAEKSMRSLCSSCTSDLSRRQEAPASKRATEAGWWFGTFFIFPYIGNNNPSWLIFFRGLETTNQEAPC